MLLQDTPERPTSAQLRRLRARQPYAVPLLRRLQVAAGAYAGVGGEGAASIIDTTEHAHVVYVYDVATAESAAICSTTDAEADALPLDTPFAAAYVDVSQAPETAAWLFCSDEAPWPWPEGEPFYADDNDVGVADRGAALVATWDPARAARCRRLALALLRHVRALAAAAASEVRPLLLARADAKGEPVSGHTTGNISTARQAAATLTTHLKATVHEGVRHLLTLGEKPVHLAFCDAYDKWLFRAADVPADGAAPAGLVWDRVRAGDVPLVVSRTAIPRTAASLLGVPGVALRHGDAAVSWAFLGIDGSLWTLHCEPEFRGRGLATAVASRLLRHNGSLFQEDAADTDLWLLADVSATNTASQAVCRRLGGRRAWATSWWVVFFTAITNKLLLTDRILLAYDSLGDD